MSTQIPLDVPLVVYGSTASYFTGKLEAYLRSKGVPYRLVPFSETNMRRCVRHTGVVQIPQVECPDGSWLVDTTLIIEYLERVRPEPAVTPRDPAVGFVSRLLEDYADEWLWRPAMHYRWSFPETARLMSAWLAEHLGERPVPQWLKRLYWRRRQHRTFVRGDGVDDATREAVEGFYLATLDALEPVFARRPYVLGERPTEADFGFFASLFRHFFSDPAPGRIMRERAPGVQEWVARMWNLRPDRFRSLPFPDRVPDDLGALFDVVTGVYLPYLEANAAAYSEGARLVRYQAEGTTFIEPVKPYRVWCRDRLQRQLVELDAAATAEVERALGSSEAVARLRAPSPRRVESVIDSLPLTTRASSKAVDSWWRR
jgi:glutathione S-transferase/Arc/MetJ family transcription regulator